MEKMNATSAACATVTRGAGDSEQCRAEGKYFVECFGSDGALKWRDEAPNVVCTAGKNIMLDAISSAYTPVGPYIGLISSIGYSATAAADTMASHAGWNEAGNGVNYPNWSTPASNARATPSWSAASAGSKAISSAVSFVIATNGGTVKGCFMVFASGAVTTNNNTSGTLLSAGVFSGGDKVVSIGDTLNVSYSLAL